MRSHRTIFTTLGLAAVLWTAAPASAGSLLSGYGGPGQGNQAILGAALLNGRHGGGHGGSGAGGAGGGTSGSAGVGQGSPATSTNGALSAAAGAGARGPTTSTGSAPGRGGRGEGGARSHGAGGPASAGGAPAYPPPSSNAAPPSADSNTLGLSGAEELFVLLALGVLALTGTLTMRLTRTTRPGGPRALKGRAAEPE
jgi:hypothetical protein